jgi:hypothetical protein
MTTIKPSFYSSSSSSHRPPPTSLSSSTLQRKGLESELIEIEQKKEIDIGVGAYHSSIKHLTASLDQMKSDLPFR